MTRPRTPRLRTRRLRALLRRLAFPGWPTADIPDATPGLCAPK